MALIIRTSNIIVRQRNSCLNFFCDSIIYINIFFMYSYNLPNTNIEYLAATKIIPFNQSILLNLYKV